MRGCLSFFTKEADLASYRTGVFVASAEPDVVYRSLSTLGKRFPQVSFTFLVPKGYAGPFSWPGPVIWMEQIKTNPLGWLASFRRRKFDLCIVLFGGRPTFRKTKLAALLLNARSTFVQDENGDAFLLNLAHWKSVMAHMRRRVHKYRLGGVRPCPICSIRASETGFIGSLERTDSADISRDRFDLTYCSCGELIYISPLPTENDFRNLYVVGRQFIKGTVYRDEKRIKSALQYYEDRTRAMLSLIGPGRAAHKFLEIGAGLSWICRVAKRISPEYETVAQDVSSEVSAECTWVDHYLVTHLQDDRIDELGPYDVISMTHVIEHLPDPVQTLRRAKALLREDGIIFVTAPHRPVGWSGTEKSLVKWLGYSYNHVPRHLQYFSRRSFEIAAVLAGLSLVHWSSEHEEGQAFEAWLRHVALSLD
jgi:SAM-dependent methyltransferase